MAVLNELASTQQEVKAPSASTQGLQNVSPYKAKASSLSSTLNSIMNSTTQLAGSMARQMESEKTEELQLNMNMAQEIAMNNARDLSTQKAELELAVIEGKVSRMDATKQLNDLVITQGAINENNLSSEAKEVYRKLYTEPANNTASELSLKWAKEQYGLDQQEVVDHTDLAIKTMGKDITPAQLTALKQGLTNYQLDDSRVEGVVLNYIKKQWDADLAKDPNTFYSKEGREAKMEEYFGSLKDSEDTTIASAISEINAVTKLNAKAHWDKVQTNIDSNIDNSIKHRGLRTKNISELSFLKNEVLKQKNMSGKQQASTIAWIESRMRDINTGTGNGKIENPLLNLKDGSINMTGKKISSSFDKVVNETNSIINSPDASVGAKNTASKTQIEAKEIYYSLTEADNIWSNFLSSGDASDIKIILDSGLVKTSEDGIDYKVSKVMMNNKIKTYVNSIHNKIKNTNIYDKDLKLNEEATKKIDSEILRLVEIETKTNVKSTLSSYTDNVVYSDVNEFASLSDVYVAKQYVKAKNNISGSQQDILEGNYMGGLLGNALANTKGKPEKEILSYINDIKSNHFRDVKTSVKTALSKANSDWKEDLNEDWIDSRVESSVIRKSLEDAAKTGIVPTTSAEFKEVIESKTFEYTNDPIESMFANFYVVGGEKQKQIIVPNSFKYINKDSDKTISSLDSKQITKLIDYTLESNSLETKDVTVSIGNGTIEVWRYTDSNTPKDRMLLLTEENAYDKVREAEDYFNQEGM